MLHRLPLGGATRRGQRQGKKERNQLVWAIGGTVGKELVLGDLVLLGKDHPELVRGDQHLLLEPEERCVGFLAPDRGEASMAQDGVNRFLEGRQQSRALASPPAVALGRYVTHDRALEREASNESRSLRAV